MTIYTPTTVEKKDTGDNPPPVVIFDEVVYTPTTVEKKDTGDNPPPVVIFEEVPDLKLKKAGSVSSDGSDDSEAALLDSAALDNPANYVIHLRRIRQKRKKNLIGLFCLLVALFVLVFALICGYKIYRYYYQEHYYAGWCGVTYTDEENHYYEFQEHVQTDALTYEEIETPNIDHFNQATILHDFEKNYTAIVDKIDRRCFILPLDRNNVKPPSDFWDLISKLRSGYYLPDERAVREDYRVIEPAVENLDLYGDYIIRSCFFFATFEMEKLEEPPRVLQKRHACNTFKVRYSAGMEVKEMSIVQCS